MIRETVQDALKEWGPEAQLLKTSEELSECAAAIARWLNTTTPENQDHLAEEIADANIMLMSAAIVVGKDRIEDWTDRKIKRLRDRLAVIEAKRRKS